jgi:hypothetical protein
MRHLMICGALLALVAVGSAAAPAKAVRPALSATSLRTLRQGLPLADLQRLGGVVTRQQQLTMLRANPQMAARLVQLGAGNQMQVMEGDAPTPSITLTPLAPRVPDGLDENVPFAALTSDAILLQPPGAVLPNAGQNPPHMWMFVTSNTAPLCTLKVRWPAPGAYMITLFMRDVIPISTAAPRVGRHTGPLQTPVADKTPGGTQWTFLWQVTTIPALPEEISVFPVDSGFGFVLCCLSKVVINKLF